MKIERDYRYGVGSCTVEDLLAVIVRAGYSNTRARRAVLEALCEAGGQATPARLLALGRIHQPSLGLVTVYRTLEILSELGLVRKLHLDEGCSTYVLSSAGIEQEDMESQTVDRMAQRHSHHVICQRCRRAAEFAGCDIETVIAAVEAQTGYSVREHWLEMFGLCPDCQIETMQDG
ncbi:MAG: Fur family transcriptional regulator [Anaerolineae bacterium]|nr:transcriptional repressor [Anaerolineae bacterium]MDW8100161.1 Fur family transcriptional regulator [Anaerolineae bacterium]